MYEFTNRLYADHAADLVAALALSTNDRDVAQDLTHDVFLRALARESELAAHPDARGWLFRTGYGLARIRWRLLLRRKHRLMRERPPIPAQAWEEAIELRESLGHLSGRQRDAVILHYFLGFPEAEIAPILGCAEGTVRSHLQRARIALARALNPEEVNG